MEIFGSDDDLSAQRKVHHRRDRLPVFQIDDKKGNTLFAFRSRLRARLEGMSAHKESRIAAAIVSRWREAFGVEQCEIDSLATLRPNVLREIIEAAFQPYDDSWVAATRALIERKQYGNGGN
jgi:hypothetical protein